MRKQKEKVYKVAFSSKEKLAALNLLKISSFEFVSHRYHCTIQTLYRWRRIYNGDIESLKNKYCAPHTQHPNSHTNLELTWIKNLLHRNPDIGLNELYGKLKSNYGYKRNPVSLYRLLKKRGLYKNNKKKIRYIPKKYDTPEIIGEKWQLDVKFVPRDCYVGDYANEKRYYQYTVIDEATRKRFIFPYEEQNACSTVDFIKRAIKFYGYAPKIIQTDNGNEFTYSREVKNGKQHLFDKFCVLNNIEHKTIRPRTPRHNGKVERSHRNDNERFYKHLKFYSFKDLVVQMSAYLKRSNDIPISCLCSRDKKRTWLTPNQKQKELLLLDWGVIA